MEDKDEPGLEGESFTVTMGKDWHISHDSPASSGDVKINNMSSHVVNIPGGDSGQLLTADGSGIQWANMPSGSGSYHLVGIDSITQTFSIEHLEKQMNGLEAQMEQIKSMIKLMKDHAKASKCKPRKLNINKDE